MELAGKGGDGVTLDQDNRFTGYDLASLPATPRSLGRIGIFAIEVSTCE
jgi:hypothetical protein